MSIRVAWVDDTKMVISREFEGTWTWEEFYVSQKEVNALLNSVEHPVHQILDFSKSRTLPANALTHIRNSGRNVPTNRGKSIVVTQSPFYLQMYRVLNRMFPSVTQRVIVVASREEALREIPVAEAQT